MHAYISGTNPLTQARGKGVCCVDTQFSTQLSKDEKVSIGTQFSAQLSKET
jgi:hypothetical protein